jgi:RNA polymerase sigma-70 factor, ECF subfamily
VEILAAPEVRHRSANDLVRKAVAHARRGDRSALDFLYVRFADEVLDYVRSLTREPDMADEITQVVFAELATAIESDEPRDVPVATWILRLARDVALDHLSAGRRLELGEPEGARVTAA